MPQSLGFLFLGLFQLIATPLQTLGFDLNRNDNLVVYWGQNSYGARNNDPANYQKRLNFYCPEDQVDIFPVAFIHVFFSTGGLPSMDLANTCNIVDNAAFPGTSLPNCQWLASDIKECQARGHLVTLSLGGATASSGFSSDAQAAGFADTLWNLFFEGSSSTRPFGDAVLDGIDLDIEGGSPTGYPAFVNRFRALSNAGRKRYYVTAAPQCPYPDASLGAVLNAVSFDMVYIQFYNNACGLLTYGQAQNWNYGIWDYWARFVSPNRNVKLFIGAPASSSAAGSHYVDAARLKTIAQATRASFPSFGGVMLWDMSQAYANGRYDRAVKGFLSDGGGTGFVYPPCSAPAYAAGSSYTAGSKVSYNNYIWEAKWWASQVPEATTNGEWIPVSACGGAPPVSATSSTTTSRTTTSVVSTTTSSTSSTRSTSTSSSTTSTGGSCAGVSAWVSTIAYTGGQQVTYGGRLWQAKWWTQAETPRSAEGSPWTDLGACTARYAATLDASTPTATLDAEEEASTRKRNLSRWFRI